MSRIEKIHAKEIQPDVGAEGRPALHAAAGESSDVTIFSSLSKGSPHSAMSLSSSLLKVSTSLTHRIVALSFP